MFVCFRDTSGFRLQGLKSWCLRKWPETTGNRGTTKNKLYVNSHHYINSNTLFNFRCVLFFQTWNFLSILQEILSLPVGMVFSLYLHRLENVSLPQIQDKHIDFLYVLFFLLLLSRLMWLHRLWNIKLVHNQTNFYLVSLTFPLLLPFYRKPLSVVLYQYKDQEERIYVLQSL